MIIGNQLELNMDIKKYLVRENVPEELHEGALACFEESKRISKPLLKYKLFAPFMLFWLIYLTKQIKWEDNVMPAKWWKWDNNISMNGDGWGTLLPDGTCLNFVDQALIDKGEGSLIAYTDERYTADAYYCKGHHPRSKLARWVWLGWRNKASAYAQSLGKDMDLNATYQRWGTHDSDVGKEGTQFHYCDGLWQMRDYKRVFFGKLCVRRNMGFKINNTFVENKPHAMVTWIPFSLRRWEGE